MNKKIIAILLSAAFYLGATFFVFYKPADISLIYRFGSTERQISLLLQTIPPALIGAALAAFFFSSKLREFRLWFFWL
jgi:hypothetical protein